LTSFGCLKRQVLSPEKLPSFKHGKKGTLENGNKIFSHFGCFTLKYCAFWTLAAIGPSLFFKPYLFTYFIASTLIRKGKVAEHLPLSLC
jgi:hypothetical protein